MTRRKLACTILPALLLVVAWAPTVVAQTSSVSVSLVFTEIESSWVNNQIVRDDVTPLAHQGFIAISRAVPPELGPSTTWTPPAPGAADGVTSLQLIPPPSELAEVQLLTQGALQECARIAKLVQLDRQDRLSLVVKVSKVDESAVSLNSNGSWLTILLQPGSQYYCQLRNQ